jgi:hypothetical protein
VSKDVGDLKARLQAHIEKYDFVTFAGLCQSFGEIDDRDDGFNLMVPGVENVCLWVGLSESGTSALIELFDEQAIHPVPCSLIIYGLDGSYPNLPVVKRTPSDKRPLKKLHWLPVALRPGPPPKTKAARKRAMVTT